MPKVFISHSWDDNEISRKLYENLTREGVDVWIDYRRMEGGDKLPKKIGEALKWCDTLLLIWSQSAAKSYWVEEEWTNAISLRKTIIPLVMDNVELPPILSNRLFINFKNFDQGYNELCRALKLQTLEEKKKSEAEKLKLEQERLQLQEAERQKKEQERLQLQEAEKNEKEKQLKLQAEYERQKQEQERLRLQDTERKEKEKQRKLQAKQENQKKEQERLQLLQAEKQQKEQLEKSIKKPITKKTVYTILLVIAVIVGIYSIKTFISSKQLQNQKVENAPTLRSDSTSLASEDVKAMLNDKNLFDSYWNKTGIGFSNRFGKAIMKDGKVVVIDTASGLMWQQSGSENYMTYDKVKDYIQELKRTKFAGFNNWRLPTLEEAMSLMEPKQMNGDLYIDPKFDANQIWIWTADPYTGAAGAQWVVSFYYGTCGYDYLLSSYVRAVRFGQSSP